MNNQPLDPTAPVGGGLSYFRFWCQKTLPAVFDNSLSYYEQLAKVVAKLNEVISNTNTQSDAIAELQNLFGDTKDYMNKVLDEINTNIQNFKTDMQTQQTTFETDLTNKQNAFENTLTEQQTAFETDLTNKQNTFENNITAQQSAYETTVNAQIAELEQNFNTLKTYVDNYFDNLDIQSEVDAKIDELKENGDLTAIIEQALNPLDKFLILADRMTVKQTTQTSEEIAKNWIEYFAGTNNLTLRDSTSTEPYSNFDIPIADIENNFAFGKDTNTNPRTYSRNEHLPKHSISNKYV